MQQRSTPQEINPKDSKNFIFYTTFNTPGTQITCQNFSETGYKS